MDMRIFVAAAVVVAMTGPALAQTKPTRPTAYSTAPTRTTAYATAAINPCYSSFNPTSPCYTGTAYPSYSAIGPPETPDKTVRQPLRGADSLSEDETKSRIAAKG